MMVTGICMDDARLAPSVTDTWTVDGAAGPMAGVSVSEQLLAPLPQFEGETTAVIQKTEGVTATLSVPVPPMVKGRGGELLPPTIAVALNPLIVGPGICARAPSASTRP